jgi:ParB-like chromosome segregation protein Spo0J
MVSMKKHLLLFTFLVFFGAVSWFSGPDNALATEEAKPKPEDIEFFEKKIRPVFVENCYICHSEHHKEAGGLRVDDFRAITNAGKNGPAVVPGDAEASLLIKRVSHVDDSKIMPPDHRLSEQQIADLKSWINRGAAWPALVIPKEIDQTLEAGVVPHQDLKETHWAWQPLREVVPPSLPKDSRLAAWPKNDVDIFIATKLAEKELTPVGDANKGLLLRRLFYDLTGLPPTEEDLLAFLLDDSSNATESVVNRLLESREYAERWGRHWLDVARYGESTGSARNLPYPHAWRYRDYVIDSFAKDKPFHQFLQEQIAGDLLPASSVSQKREQLVATGFLALGVKDVNQRFKVRYDMDNVDEQIDTISRAVLGLTVSCARCHDHKFDPVSTRDYYALAGIFTSTEQCDALRNQMGGAGLAYYVPDRLIALGESESKTSDEEIAKQVEEKRAEFEAARAVFTSIRDSVKQKDRGEEHARKLQKARQAMQRKQAELVALTDPAKNGPVAIGVRDAKQVGDTEIRIRGEAEKHGPTVPRGFLTLLDYVPAKPIEEGRSGRYELAKWLTEPSNPLTSRVVVNRIWQHLFGDGIVTTVDNFGSTGDTPTHPELLDYLAKKFVNEGWSHKNLIRYLVLSRTYQLSSQGDASNAKVDPSNRFQWRHAPRRLEAEEIRDSILAVSGDLNRKPISGSAAKDLPVIEIRNNGPEAKNLLTAAVQSNHRSVYLPLARGITPNVLQVFDIAEQGMVTGKRTNTTVAPQALFMLNDNFVRMYSSVVATRLQAETRPSEDSRIALIYRRILQRQPSADEIKNARDFLKSYRDQFVAIAKSQKEEIKVSDATTEGNSSPNDVGKSSPAPVKSTATSPLANAAAPEDSRESDANLDNTIEVPEPKTPDEAAWIALVQSLFSSGEFRFVR